MQRRRVSEGLLRGELAANSLATARKKSRTLTERDIFLIVSLKYATGGLPLPHREVLKRLRQVLFYGDLSERQLRRLIERALNDTRVYRFLEIRLTPPIDWDMGVVLQRLLPNVREVFVTPSTEDLAPGFVKYYLGLTAARVFSPRFIGGQLIGLGPGTAVQAFAANLSLRPEIAGNLRFCALAYFPNEEGKGTGAEPTMEAVSRCASIANSPSVEGFIAPSQLRDVDLHWAIVEIEPVWEERTKTVACILSQPLTKDGLFPASSIASHQFERVPLTLLQRMVKQGKGVVAIVGGSMGAEAVLATLQAQKWGGPLFNFLVTDDVCAAELLRRMGYRVADVPRRQEWWMKRHCFLAAHLRYGDRSLHRTYQEIAHALSVSIKQVRRLLTKATQTCDEGEPILTLRVQPPSSERAAEFALLQKWQLKEVRVVPSLNENSGETLRLLGEETVRLFTSLVEGKDSVAVGLGGGRAVRAFLEALDFDQLLRQHPSLKRLILCALTPNPFPRVLGVVAETLLAPLATRYKTDRLQICRYTPKGIQLDAVFLSVGSSLAPDNIFFFAQEEEIASMREQIAGLILFSFITHEGRTITPRWARELGAFSLNLLSKMVSQGKPVVLLAQGVHKVPVILAARRAGLFNCLVVDRDLAEALIAQT